MSNRQRYHSHTKSSIPRTQQRHVSISRQKQSLRRPVVIPKTIPNINSPSRQRNNAQPLLRQRRQQQHPPDFSRLLSGSRHSPVHLTKSNHHGAQWVNNHFVRSQQFGWFSSVSPIFWRRHPWFLNWYNARYAWPFLVLTTFTPLIIVSALQEYATQRALDDFITHTEFIERAAGRAPSDPSAHLVPNYSTHPPVLMWAIRTEN